MKKFMVQERFGKVEKRNGVISIKKDDATMTEEMFENENEARKSYASKCKHQKGLQDYFKGGYYTELSELIINGEDDVISSEVIENSLNDYIDYQNRLIDTEK